MHVCVCVCVCVCVQKVITLWLKAIFRLVELLPTHPAIIQDAIFSAPQTATPAQETATPTQETAKPDTQQTATPTQQITKPDGQAATPQPGPSLEPSSASQPEPAGAKQQATEKQPTATTEKQPTGSSGEAITPKSEDTVVTVHTPFHHILRGGALWGPWIVGVAGVAILGMLLYRCVPSLLPRAIGAALGWRDKGNGGRGSEMVGLIGLNRQRYNGRTSGWQV